jgi:acetyl esterase/lipase
MIAGLSGVLEATIFPEEPERIGGYAMITRRDFLKASTLTAVGTSHLETMAGERCAIKTTTHTYKTVGDLQIKADIHRPNDKTMRLVVVRIHGGALINGRRKGINRAMRMMLDAGYAVVSIDYRLAPETKLPAIIEDVEDAFHWIRREGLKLANLDTSKIAVIGGSAGGYLTLVTGYRVQPRPTVLVSFYGYGDIIGDWYSKPSPHYQGKAITDQEAQALATGPPVADDRRRKGDGGTFYRYCRKHGLWPKYVSGFDPHTEPEKFDPFMPVKNVTKDYPPTVLIHGQKDTDVPHEQSVLMAEQFKKHGVPYLFFSLENGEHGLRDADDRDVDRAYREALAFVNKYMKTSKPT